MYNKLCTINVKAYYLTFSYIYLSMSVSLYYLSIYWSSLLILFYEKILFWIVQEWKQNESTTRISYMH